MIRRIARCFVPFVSLAFLLVAATPAAHAQSYAIRATLPNGYTYPEYANVPLYAMLYANGVPDKTALLETVWVFPTTSTVYTSPWLFGPVYQLQHPNIGGHGGTPTTVTVSVRFRKAGVIVAQRFLTFTRQ